MPVMRLLACLTIPLMALLVSTTAIVSISSSDPEPRDAERPPDAQVTRQVRDMDCGLAAIATVAPLLGVSLPEYGELLARYPPHSYGYSADDLAHIASALGIRLQPVRVNAAGLRSIPLPALLHLRTDHFVVLVDRSPSAWQVANPARGVQRLRPAVVESLAAGTALLADVQKSVRREGSER